MNLKNKDIAEGMRVTNGKDKLRVVTWDKSYSDCLLNYLDSKGTRYVVAQNYELSGTEKDPQISWMNGRYFTANSDDEALEEYLDYLGEVNEYDISESLKKSIKSLKESAKPIDEKNVAKFVDELNKWVDKTINYADENAIDFTKKYGKLYSFDYIVDSDGTIRVYDEEGTLDWWDGGRVVEFIKNRANGYGWYAEACSGDSDFCFGEL